MNNEEEFRLKKILSVILCAVMCLSLFAACGEKKEAAPLQEVYASLQAVPGMPEMAVMPDALIETLFGFDLTQFDEYVFAEAATPDINAEAIILIKLGGSADSAAVQAALESYLSSVRENTATYSPENHAKASASEIINRSGYVCLVIASDYQAAVDVIEQAGI